MNEIIINQEWTFKEVVENIEAIKYQIWDVLASFSNSQKKEKISFMYKLRKNIYLLKFERWRCDKIVEFIYNDIEFEVLKSLI